MPAQALTNGASFTPNALLGNYQAITNNSTVGNNVTINPPSVASAIDLAWINGAAVTGSVTFSGFNDTGSHGDPITTVAGAKFIISIRKISAAVISYYVKACQRLQLLQIARCRAAKSYCRCGCATGRRAMSMATCRCIAGACGLDWMMATSLANCGSTIATRPTRSCSRGSWERRGRTTSRWKYPAAWQILATVTLTTPTGAHTSYTVR